MNDEFLIPYLAGYIDGDGCFYIGKSNNKYRASLIISSAHPGILYYFKSKFGGSVTQSYKNPSHHKIMHSWSISTTLLRNLISDLIPFLVEKREDAEWAMQFFDASSSKKDRLIRISRDEKKSHHKITHQHFQEIKNIKPCIQPNQENLAYVAGFIDAEACIGINRYKSQGKYVYKPFLHCNDSCYPIFYWVAKRFGGPFYFRPFHDSNRRSQIAWRMTSRKLSSFLNQVHPFLRHKQPMAEIVLKFNETILPNGGDRHSSSFKEKFSKANAIREELFFHVKHLNSKGRTSV